MMARSPTSSNQRPDTLMQDRSPPTRRKPLATHGRTIHRVKSRPMPNGGIRQKAPFPIPTDSNLRQTRSASLGNEGGISAPIGAETLIANAAARIWSTAEDLLATQPIGVLARRLKRRKVEKKRFPVEFDRWKCPIAFFAP